ncbi:MAG TPA: GNAT family N-acetyltransferase [Acetobacteraceae bacterium]|jgi:ribosomal protein S18 acetylase RimI-like enzyme
MRTAMQIKPATPADVQTVRDIVCAAYAKWVPIIGREPLPMRADYEHALRHHSIDLLHRDGDVIALIQTIPNPDHLFIENLAVAPPHQGQGLGRHLLAHAEQKAQAAGLPEIRLLTNSAFDANIHLYQHVGYRIDREEPFMGGTTVYMGKKMTSS